MKKIKNRFVIDSESVNVYQVDDDISIKKESSFGDHWYDYVNWAFIIFTFGLIILSLTAYFLDKILN